MSVGREGKRKWGSAVGVLVAGTALMLVLIFRPSSEDGQPATIAGYNEVRSISQRASPEPVKATEAKAEPSPAYDGVLDPAVVIDNPECDIGEGFGAAEGVAAVVIPTPTGSRFSVLDGSGAIFGGELPFNPNVQRIGRRADGTVVVALGDMRSDPIGAPQTPKPVRVYIDGVLIYEQETVWHFDVADDGSSFYAIEPLPGDVSRLVINSLDLRRISHFDLGDLITPWKGYDFPYGASFAKDHASVMFWPAYADAWGRGTHWFFPVDGSDRWSIDPRISENDPLERTSEAMFASSTEVFVTYNDEDPKGGSSFKRIVKRSYGPAPRQGKFTTLWSRTLDLNGVGQLDLSDNGKWLAVGSSHLHVLNAETGETVFAFPTLENLSRHLSAEEKRQIVVRPDGRRRTWEGHLNDVAALARLRSVLGPDASLTDVGGGGIDFRGDRLLMYRTTNIGSPNARRYQDVFDLEGIDIDGPPTFRTEWNRDYRCHSGDFYTQGLQIHDGELTYLTTAR